LVEPVPTPPPVVNVSVDAVIREINKRYNKIIVALVNENAELVAMQQGQSDVIAEQASELEALRAIMADDTKPEPSPGD
jgi:hypothetical protein